MRRLLGLLIISFALIAISSPIFPGDNRKNKIKDKRTGNPFGEILEQITILNEKLDELLANGADLRGVTQNWDKKLDSTNGEADGCNSDRYTCVLDGQAVRDNETGIVWDRSPNQDLIVTWEGAIIHCAQRVAGGRMGWHLPTIEQLTSVWDPSFNEPALPPNHPFLDIVVGAQYWSSSTAPTDQFAGHAWAVTSNTGRAEAVTDRGIGARAWCVRGAQSYDGQDVQEVIDVLP